MKENKLQFLIILIVMIFIVGGCKTIKPYQRSMLNDKQMKTSDSALSKFENKSIEYREGASGGSSESSSGGCGCN